MLQGHMCVDTLGHIVNGTIGLYSCHNGGGNQVLGPHTGPFVSFQSPGSDFPKACFSGLWTPSPLRSGGGV